MLIVETTKEDANRWFGEHHYTGTTGGCWFFSVEDDYGRLCLVAIGKGGNRFGVAEKFSLERWSGNLEITRVACSPYAPKNSASKCLAAVCKKLADERQIDWLFSYSDTAQKHHGGIYQALNAVYVGTDARQWVCFELDGKRVSKRMVSGKFGHTKWPEVQEAAREKGHQLNRVPWLPKLTYILPISTSKKTRDDIRKHLTQFQRPYPKRNDTLHKHVTPHRNSRKETQPRREN